MSQERMQFGFWGVTAFFVAGIVVGAVQFSTVETKTVTKWATPDDRVSKYSINDISGEGYTKNDDGKITGVDYSVVEYSNAPQMFKGGSIIIKNGIEDINAFNFDKTSIDSIEYNAKIYQNGQLIDSYNSTCRIYEDYERDIGENEINEIYNECFNIQVNN